MLRGDAKVFVNSLELMELLLCLRKEYLCTPFEVRLLETLPRDNKPTHRSNKSINILFIDQKISITLH